MRGQDCCWLLCAAAACTPDGAAFADKPVQGKWAVASVVGCGTGRNLFGVILRGCCEWWPSTEKGPPRRPQRSSDPKQLR
jgi:hypothetical protein